MLAFQEIAEIVVKQEGDIANMEKQLQQMELENLKNGQMKDIAPLQNTYANVVKNVEEALIKIHAEPQHCEITTTKIYNSINLKKDNIQIQKMNKTNNQGIIIHVQQKKHPGKIKEIIRTRTQNLKVKDIKKKNPKIVIYNLDKTLTTEEIY
ncbi:hypothetical protein PR048_023740 [Dryococelus australis]|uniref:Uncharacterized protein n=1 Tax=Dryococelus australis TaxID=614101 RepID=A0ABQ9GUX3_9NEOP|nr:hypothetical protein PR048_023740 [Dryococelus australis]